MFLSSRFIRGKTLKCHKNNSEIICIGQLGDEGQQASFLDLPLDQQLPVQAWIMAYDLSNINIEMKVSGI